MKFYSQSVLSALVILSESVLLALPTGAPICSIDADRITSGHTQPSADSALDYELKSEKVNDTSYQISISSQVETSFKGVLIYVIGSDPKTHAGFFVLPNDNFKFQRDVCQSEGIGGTPESTITHSNPTDKLLSEIKFQWSFSKDEKGPFKVMAIVAKDRNPWKLVKELALGEVFVPPYEAVSSSCSTTSTRAPETTASNSVVHKIFKCTKVKRDWRSKN
jgi:hypothetical protein